MSGCERGRGEHADLAAETCAIWEANAAFCDERIGEGNCFQRLLAGLATDSESA